MMKFSAFWIIAIALAAMFVVYGVPRTHYVVLKCSFHTHTTASDGAYNATYLMDLYHAAGYDCIAITDHNTIASWADAKEEGSKLGMVIIQGEEVSCRWPDGTPQHVLALFINSKVTPNSTYADPAPLFDLIHQAGGIAEVAHPQVYTQQWNTTFDWTLTKWYNFWNAPYIDGFEWSTGWSAATATLVLNHANFISYNHDYHGSKTTPEPAPNPPFPSSFTYVFAIEKNEWGVRDALSHQRDVCVSGNKIVGTAEALALYKSLVVPYQLFP